MSEAFQDRAEGKNVSAHGGEKRKPLRQIVAEIDRDILKMLARRYNLLEKMRKNGRLEAADEKFIREAWQASVAKMSRDPQLAGHFFSLMQELSFMPRPAGEGAGKTQGESRKEAFNLAPAKTPVNVSLPAPLDSFSTLAWIYLAAASGRYCRIQPALQNDIEVEFEKALERLGVRVSRLNEIVEAGPSAPLAYADAAIYVGNGAFCFYLLLAHYLGRTSRVRFDGGQTLKLADFSILRPTLVALGARITHIVPRSSGLPCRVECSGILPPVFKAEAHTPPEFCQALMLAASFYSEPFAVDLSAHSRSDEIYERIMPILKMAGANFVMDGKTINFQPCALSIPANPVLPMDANLAPYILALAVPNGGEVKLEGQWTDMGSPPATLAIMARNGIEMAPTGTGISIKLNKAPGNFKVSEKDLKAVPARQLPLLAALGACVKLSGGTVNLSPEIGEYEGMKDFFHACGLSVDEFGNLEIAPAKSNPVWTVPSSWWAFAFAIAACARPGWNGFQLGNPGIVTSVWPKFWYLYNNLPAPEFNKSEPEPVQEKSRRRILTEAVAKPREIREEDWER